MYVMFILLFMNDTAYCTIAVAVAGRGRGRGIIAVVCIEIPLW
jgi:hypothetical protein